MRRIPEAAAWLALLAPAVMAAQPVERSTFYLIVGADTVTIERTTRSADTLRFQLFDRKSRTLVDFAGALTPGALVASGVQEVFANASDPTPALRVTSRFSGDSVGIQRGTGAMNWVRVGAGAIPSMNVSAALLEQAILRARAIGGDSVTIPQMFLPSGPAVPVTILREGSNGVLVRVGAVAIHATLAANGTLAGATIPTQNARYARGPATSGAFPGLKSFAPPPGAPYTAQDVTIQTKAGLTLRGTLTMPQRGPGASVPAIVTITGSGPQDRDATPQGLSGYRLYYQLADTLGRRGIAVLRLDDRGAGSDMGPPTVTSADFADDIRAAVEWLRQRPEIDAARIGLVGHSEGGIIGPMVAASDSGIAAVVILAGTISKGREIIEFQQRYVVDSMARLQGDARAAALAQYARNTDSVAAAMPWMRFFLEYDPAPAARSLRAPALILHGEKDNQVPAAEAGRLASAIRGGGNRDVTVRVIPGLNHLFVPEGGVGFSYEKLPSLVVGPEVLGAIADWLSARLGR